MLAPSSWTESYRHSAADGADRQTSGLSSGIHLRFRTSGDPRSCFPVFSSRPKSDLSGRASATFCFRGFPTRSGMRLVGISQSIPTCAIVPVCPRGILLSGPSLVASHRMDPRSGPGLSMAKRRDSDPILLRSPFSRAAPARSVGVSGASFSYSDHQHTNVRNPPSRCPWNTVHGISGVPRSADVLVCWPGSARKWVSYKCSPVYAFDPSR